MRLEFYSRPVYLAVVRRMLDTLCDRMGLNGHQSARICLAVDEALCNVIRHGYDNDPDGRIELTVTDCQTDGSPSLVVEILDRARQVDLETIRSRDLEDVQPGGLGVHIISEIMEDVEYSHRDGGGMQLRMRHTLPEASASGRNKNDG